MKFSYRGSSYENTSPTLEVTEGEILAKYRGQNYKVQYPRHVQVPDVIVNLKYRGVPYIVGKTGTTDTLKRQHLEQLVNLPDCKLSVDKNRQKMMDEAARMHLESIRRSLEHRIQVAKANGDENLIRLLEAESKQLSAC